jgi:hypothetical protein
MKKIIFAVLIGIAFSGMSVAMAAGDHSMNTVIAAQLDKVHAATLAVAPEKDFTVQKDVKYATAFRVDLKAASGREVQVWLQMNKNRTDVRIVGEDHSEVKALLDALRARF